MSKRPKTISEIAETIALFPLSGALLLPGTQRPLMVFEPRYIALVDAVLAGDRMIGLIQPKNHTVESPPERQVELNAIGCLGYISQFEETFEENYVVVLDGVVRFEIVEEFATDLPFRKAKISSLRFIGDFDHPAEDNNVDREKFLLVMRAYAEFADFDFDWDGIKNLSTVELINICCLLAPYGAREKQVLLEATSLVQRAETLIALAEIEMARGNPGSKLQ